MTIQTKTRIPPFEGGQLESLCRAIADTATGLTGTEIGRFLEECKIEDTDPSMTKWRRLFNAFVTFQNRTGVGNHVLVFINKAMSAARYTGNPELFNHRKDELNKVLALAGMQIGDDGRIRHAARASTLDEAIERASRFKAQLERRGVHPDVLEYCKSEIIAQNYFHAVFEAMKSISSKIRKLSGLDGDGHDLYDRAFALGKDVRPVLAINALTTETLRGEQRGFLNLLKGLFGAVRNPLGHEGKVEWDMSEQDALDIMTAISLVHRKLDRTTRYSSNP